MSKLKNSPPLHKQVMDCRPGLVIAFCFFLVTMMYTNGVIFLNICSGLSKTQSQSVWVCWAGWVRLIYWNMIVVRPEDNSKHLYSLYLHHISISPWIWALLSIAFRSICNIYSVVVRSIWREYHQIKGHYWILPHWNKGLVDGKFWHSASRPRPSWQ